VVCWCWVSDGDGVVLVMALFGYCCGDVFMIKKVRSFFTTFQSVPGSKKARHGAEQKTVLFRVTFVKKYESTNFFIDTLPEKYELLLGTVTSFF